MVAIKSLLSATLLVTSAFGAAIVRRQSATQCGNDYYTADQVNDAINQGYNYYENGQTVGEDSYPHTYNDYEGFSFNGVSGPYQEFPIQEDGVYTGGSPGADRVVFNTNGEYAGVITHSGASGNDFVACSGTD